MLRYINCILVEHTKTIAYVALIVFTEQIEW